MPFERTKAAFARLRGKVGDIDIADDGDTVRSRYEGIKAQLTTEEQAEVEAAIAEDEAQGSVQSA